MALIRGPIRLGVGETIVDGEIHMVLACGHTVVPNLDEDGLWLQEAKCCKQCLAEFRAGSRPNFGLTDEDVSSAIAKGDWDLSDDERRDLVLDAQDPWNTVRYGKRHGVEQGTEGS